jgi:hypothetical protein
MHIPFIRNWRSSRDPLAVKIGDLLKNSTRKVVTLSSCCGNHGEVGC